MVADKNINKSDMSKTQSVVQLNERSLANPTSIYLELLTTFGSTAPNRTQINHRQAHLFHSLRK